MRQLSMTSSSSSFEGYSLQVRHKQDWGRGFILLLPQTAALPGSDAGSDVIKPASSFVIYDNERTLQCICLTLFVVSSRTLVWETLTKAIIILIFADLGQNNFG